MLKAFWRNDPLAPEPGRATVTETDPLRSYMQSERYGLVVTRGEQWRGHPDYQTLFQKALDIIDDRFALVPEGFVSMPTTLMDMPGCPEVDLETEPFLLARTCVTNAQYQKFVDAGAYEDLEVWPEELWPHLISFHDQTGKPGPRFWRGGKHDRAKADHPVVGICCAEADAYARWAGFRLPTEAEWQMAASWRIRSSAHVFRRYPWGDALDTKRCNIWSTGTGSTTPVTGFSDGAAPNGVLQLIGNVWEWTSSDLELTDEDGTPLIGDMLMKAIRGGAYDTYFPCQATSTFRTGLACLSRTHNVGFRCVLDAGKPGA
ncbi:MAG TPA: SUMF1/EgtB/PvdO family nonheme iron enzyme [Candidatus Binatia bacterium]|nr:SUMF1/EgtB/PvdO family nonheme iron enzyme [Candidatus Binatia bacterium]